MKRVQHGLAMRNVLAELSAAGGAMTRLEFAHILARYYSTKISMIGARKDLLRQGYIQVRVQLTASGSIKSQKLNRAIRVVE